MNFDMSQFDNNNNTYTQPYDTSYGYDSLIKSATNKSDSGLNFGGGLNYGGVGNGIAGGVNPLATQSSSIWGKLFGGTDPKTGMNYGGAAMPAVGLLQAGLGYFQGKDQLDFSKDQLATQKQQFSDQFNVQKKLTNMDILDHARNKYSIDPTRNANPDASDWAKNNLLV